MKSMIFLAILITTLIVQAHGSCDLQTMAQDLINCGERPKAEACKCLSDHESCLEGKSDLYDPIRKVIGMAKTELKCGASSLTNVGLPMMILVALAAFFNK